jgi:hypothetical protein
VTDQDSRVRWQEHATGAANLREYAEAVRDGKIRGALQERATELDIEAHRIKSELDQHTLETTSERLLNQAHAYDSADHAATRGAADLLKPLLGDAIEQRIKTVKTELATLKTEQSMLADKILNAEGKKPLTIAQRRTDAADLWNRWPAPLRGNITDDVESIGSASGEWTTDTHFRLRWYSLGFPTFEITGGLAVALAATECKGLVGADLRFPFPACAIQFPSPSPIVYASGPLRAAFVNRVTAGDITAFTIELFTDKVLTRHVTAPTDAEPVEAWLKRVAAEVDYRQDAATLRWLVNLAVYINSLHSLPQAEGRRKRSEPRTTELLPPQRWVLGREIKLSPGMAQAVLATTRTSTKTRAAYRMHARWLVRGHWRNQVCGKGRSDRRKRWIEPHWKGPEMADALARLYDVHTDEPKGNQ